MESIELNKCESEHSPEELDPCAIGLADCNLKCHSMGFYARKIGFKFFKDFDAEEQELLSKRSSLKFKEESRICLQHESYFLTRYEQQQKYCCNPFSKENHVNKKSLKVINCSTADKLNEIVKKNVKPGQKWCIACHKEFKVELAEASSSDSNQDIEMEVSEDVNTSLTSLGISPLKFQKVSKRDSRGYARRKVKQAQESITSKIAAVGRLPEGDIGEASSSQTCENCDDYNQLLEELKIRCQEVTLKEKIQILTLAPKSWSIRKTAEEFHVSTRTVKQARKLGLLAMPEKKRGKMLTEDTKDSVKMFFEDYEFSRMCPGKKDYVSVRIDGEKVQKQKRLLLCNLKEMFKAYQERNLPKIGFSKFCELRPKWCVTVGSSGTHSVCVCTIHQNVKLMLAGSHIEEDYKFLIKKTVCSLESKDCMIHRCEECPEEEALKEYLVEFFKDNNPEEMIEFKQWIHTDRN